MNNSGAKNIRVQQTTRENRQPRAPFGTGVASQASANRTELATVTAYTAEDGHTVTLRDANGGAGPSMANLGTWPSDEVFAEGDEVVIIFRRGQPFILGSSSGGSATNVYVVLGWMSTCTE